MKVHVLPIEPFEERYTSQWAEWWPADLRAAGLEVNVINGTRGARERDGGEFLDPCATWEWKGTQVASLAEHFANGKVCDGDVILSLDGWGPATTAAAYMRDTLRRDVRIVLFMHAGSYDPWDFLARCGTEQWAGPIERGWFNAADLLLVGSDFHARLLTQKRGARPEKIAVVGVPIKPASFGVDPVPWDDKASVVVFPHREAPEKAPWEFDVIRERFDARYPDYAGQVWWVRTRDPAWAGTRWDGYTSKAHYYRLLSRASVVVSTARQETFGIAMQEGIALGAWAVAPNRLSYPEVINEDNGYLFSDLEGAAYSVRCALDAERGPKWTGYHERAIGRAAREIVGRFGR